MSHHHDQPASIDRLKAIMGLSIQSSRSPFASHSADDLSACVADLRHHSKYFSSLHGYTPSPVAIVQRGLESMSYLTQFGPDSDWYADIQQFKANVGERRI